MRNPTSAETVSAMAPDIKTLVENKLILSAGYLLGLPAYGDDQYFIDVLKQESRLFRLNPELNNIVESALLDGRPVAISKAANDLSDATNNTRNPDESPMKSVLSLINSIKHIYMILYRIRQNTKSNNSIWDNIDSLIFLFIQMQVSDWDEQKAADYMQCTLRIKQALGNKVDKSELIKILETMYILLQDILYFQTMIDTLPHTNYIRPIDTTTNSDDTKLALDFTTTLKEPERTGPKISSLFSRDDGGSMIIIPSQTEPIASTEIERLIGTGKLIGYIGLSTKGSHFFKEVLDCGKQGVYTFLY